jgi:hypothetical protein
MSDFQSKPNSSYKVPMKPRAILAGKPINSEQLGKQIARALGQADVLFMMWLLHGLIRVMHVNVLSGNAAG